MSKPMFTVTCLKVEQRGRCYEVSTYEVQSLYRLSSAAVETACRAVGVSGQSVGVTAGPELDPETKLMKYTVVSHCDSSD